MKYLKLFEEFINEGDPLADLMGGGEEEKEEKEPKEDPLEKEKEKERKKSEKAKEKHEEFVDKKEDKIDTILSKLPEVDEKIGDKIRHAIKDQDRVKIHNAALDITYMQQDYAMSGNEDMVNRMSPLKDYVDDLDRSFTSDKMM